MSVAFVKEEENSNISLEKKKNQFITKNLIFQVHKKIAFEISNLTIVHFEFQAVTIRSCIYYTGDKDFQFCFSLMQIHIILIFFYIMNFHIFIISVKQCSFS